jgi:hypothetical protein
LTLCVLVAFPIAILIGASKVSIEDWDLAALVVLLGLLAAVLVVWVGTLTAACLAIIPAWVLRRCGRLSRASVKSSTSQACVWDHWMDDPEPR